jgi:DNA-directed RNA polymerase subunit K/omega
MSEETTRTEPKSIYERVMVSAREARRLNQRAALAGIPTVQKPTLEAMRRVDAGSVNFEYDAAQEPAVSVERLQLERMLAVGADSGSDEENE